jgi:hypothetical protein
MQYFYYNNNEITFKMGSLNKSIDVMKYSYANIALDLIYFKVLNNLET